MKNQKFKLFVIILLCFWGVGISAQQNELTSCEWRFSGHIGDYVDRIANQRILNLENWNTIYPETEDAFRLREDDHNYPKNGEWRGEFWGKYMLSAIAACRYYHSDELKSRIAVAVKGLLSTQEANGYIGTYSHPDFVKGDNWNVWCHKYTLWGLVEAYSLLKDPVILKSAERFANHLIQAVGPNAEDIIQTGNFYGMPSCSILYPMVQLYNATGNRKYLDYSEYIVTQWSKHPAGLPEILNNGLKSVAVHNWSSKIDPSSWAKGYELTSCVEGLLELYKVTKNPSYFAAVKNIHREMVKYERSPVGSVSFDDKFVGSTSLINTISEICDVVYWNRLSYDLFQQTGDEQYVAEIERTFYNSLLCAFNPSGDWGLRRLRMSHIHVPAHNHFLMNHQCCTDNLPRALFQASEAALSVINGDVYLSMFNEGTGKIQLPNEKTINLKVEGDFIQTKSFNVKIQAEHPASFRLKIRMPDWSSKTIVRINGKLQQYDGKCHWLTVKRMWKNGDVVDIHFAMNLRWEKFSPATFSNEFHELSYYDRRWANIGFIKGSNEKNNQRFNQKYSLEEKDALPRKTAVTFFYGPLALARDVRISNADVFATIESSSLNNNTSAHLIDSPSGIWHTFSIDFGNGKTEKFCDFSSAGNTWSQASQFNTWCILQ
ncbi:MAG: glycoside hydrolase family 127 protein [Bacteroidales bacterium]|nr:glycoside hydrolase family 127 protein [Bacteroidales bacterium]